MTGLADFISHAQGMGRRSLLGDTNAPQKSFHNLPMCPPRNPCPELPPCHGKGAGSLPLEEAKLTALGDEPAGECPFIDRLRVIAEEGDDGPDELDCRLCLQCLPIDNRPSVHPEPFCRLLLGEGEHASATADMFT